jgi:hypothetical protein
VRIGNTSITSIGGQVSWSTLSDGRFKKNVSEDVKGLDFITQLRPVTYQLDIDKINAASYPGKSFAMDNSKSPRVSGFIAQEVEALANKIGYDFDGVDAPKNEKDFYGLRYAEFVVPLVKAVQEQQQIIEQQKKELDQYKILLNDFSKRLDALEKK